jgi:hypothetical protein
MFDDTILFGSLEGTTSTTRVRTVTNDDRGVPKLLDE